MCVNILHRMYLMSVSNNYCHLYVKCITKYPTRSQDLYCSVLPPIVDLWNKIEAMELE